MSHETASQESFKSAAFSYRGFKVPELEIPTFIISDLNAGKQAYELAPESIPLSWRLVLYLVGRDLSWGDNLYTIPYSVKEAGKLIYADAQERKERGVWHKDGILYMRKCETPKGMRQMPDGYVLARHFKDIEGFEGKDDDWTIRPSPDTEESLIWLPEGGGGFPIPTGDGPYNSKTGTPFDTVKQEKEAINRWMETGLTEEQAKNELSRVYRRDSGVAAICSWSGEKDGPFAMYFGMGPSSKYHDIGAFSAKRMTKCGGSSKRTRTTADDTNPPY